MRLPATSIAAALLAVLVPLAHDARAQGIQPAPDPDFGASAERERTFDLVHADIDVKLDIDQELVAGRVTHTMKSLRDSLSEVQLDSEGLTIKSATVNGKSTTYRSEGRKLFIALPSPAKWGEELTVALDYEGHPSTGLFWVHADASDPKKTDQCWTQGEDEDNHLWVPIYDFPNDRCTWTTHLTVRDGLTAVSNGVFAGADAAGGGWKTFTYKMEQPNVVYLIALAVGPWERYADEWRGKQVEYFVNKGVGEATARRSFGQTPDMLEFFSNVIGVEYPWNKYAQVAVSDFVVGGMENVTCTLQTDRTLHDEVSHLERSSQGLVAHELAHQWFGDYVTCRTWKDLWLNEGFATFYAALYAEHADGVDDYRLEMWDQQRGFMNADPAEDPRPIVSDFYSRVGGASNHVYTKGSSVLHMLRFVLGDAAYHRSIKTHLERGKLGLATTHDLEMAIADTTGQSLEWFFEEWVRLAGYPKFQVSFEYDDATKNGTLTVKQTQNVGKLVPVFRTPVDVELVVDGKPDLRRIFVTDKEQTFSFALSGRPSRVRFDKGGWILKTLDFQKSVEEWMEIAEKDDDVIGRLEAVTALSDNADPRAAECLARVLASKDHYRVRNVAATGLGKKGGDAARAALMIAAKDPEARVRRTAVDQLGAFEKDESVVALLHDVLDHDVAYGPRSAALGSLQKVKAPDVADAAEAAMSIASEDDQIARAGLRALAAADAKRAAPKVLELTKKEAPASMRQEAIRLLGDVAPQFTPEQRTVALEAARGCLKSKQSRVRAAGASALAGLKATEALDELDDLAKNDKREFVKRSAKDAAEKIRKDSAPAGNIDDLKKRIDELERRLNEARDRGGRRGGANRQS